MKEFSRSGFDRREKSIPVDHDRRSGKDRRITANNYYRFIKILEKIPIFEELKVDQFQKILNICSKREYKKDEYLCMEGDNSYEMHILLVGELKIVLPGGKEISRIKPVGIVGEMGIFTGEQRSASVIAMTDCVALILNKIEIMDLFRKDCILAVHIMMNVIKDLSHKLQKNNVIIDEMRQLCMPGEFTKILSKILMEEEKK